MLAVLVPTVMMTGIGIVLLLVGDRYSAMSLIAGVLVLTLCASGITGYILGSIYVGKGASLVRVQNDFVSAVSHELRTPVTSLRLLIESLRDGRLADADREQVLSLLARETDRLEQLVMKVLELSKLESGGHIYQRQRVELGDLVDEAVAAFDALTLERPTPITTHVEPHLIVIGDRATLVRAIVNLLTNAWKYTGDDKRISIDARSAGRWIEVAVTDNGVGIPRDEQAAIYDQFSRGRDALASGAPGMGLGLAFVRAIVRGHRGKLQLTSRPGETAFRIRLPRGREQAPLVPRVAARSTP
jgi:two-component system phosphate regulon sensor histidine kinase PhoR